MARETKIGLLVGLAFIILFGIILSEKGTGRNDQLTTPPIAAYKSVVELIPPTAPPSAQVSRNGKEEVADRLTMTEPGLKLTEPTTPANTNTADPAVKPVEASPVEKIQATPTDLAPKLKQMLPPSPTKSLTQIPAANPTATDITAVVSGQDIESKAVETTVASAADQTPKPEAEAKAHTVQQGETLASICRQYYPGQAYEMLKQVMTYNKISRPEKLMCGQVVKLPPAKTPVDGKVAAKQESTELDSAISNLLVPVDNAPVAAANATDAKSVKVTLISEDKVAKQRKDVTPKLARVNKSNSGKTYVVQSKDTLVKIARRVYGTDKAWTKIYEMNKKAIADPKNLKSGLKLRMPATPAGELAAGPKAQD